MTKTTFFPTGTTQSDMLYMLKEAVEKANPAIIRGAGKPMGQSVTLANGLSVKLFTLYEEGVFKVVTFYPEAGPGITRAIDVVNLVT